jgi:hypothetical protein
MYKALLIISTLFLVSCTTTKPVDKTVAITKGVVQAPIKTVVYIGENGKRTIVNYYGTLEELNENNHSNEVLLYKLEF